jgi:hypothetical protein
MELHMLVVHLARSYCSSFRLYLSQLAFRSNPQGPFLLEEEEMDAPQIWLRMRLQMLRRDRFRCRACDRQNGEVLLTIHSIRPGLSQTDELLTLCTSCRSLAKHLELNGVDALDFLRELWRHLYRPVMPTSAEHSKLNIGFTSR